MQGQNLVGAIKLHDAMAAAASHAIARKFLASLETLDAWTGFFSGFGRFLRLARQKERQSVRK